MKSNNTEKNDASQSFCGIYPTYKMRGETLAALLVRFRSEHDLDEHVKLTYAGRLDPMAEGLVLVPVGDARFEKDALLGLPKVYEVDVLLGIATDTADSLGMIEHVANTSVSDEKITQAVASMKGITELSYPMYSSVPVDGKPLFVHTREGRTVEVPSKKVTIYDTAVLGIDTVVLSDIARSAIEDIRKVEGDFRQQEIIKKWERLLGDTSLHTMVRLRIHASSGTYMRSLATWLGEQLGLPALAYRINRQSIGNYKN